MWRRSRTEGERLICERDLIDEEKTTLMKFEINTSEFARAQPKSETAMPSCACGLRSIEKSIFARSKMETAKLILVELFTDVAIPKFAKSMTGKQKMRPSLAIPESNAVKPGCLLNCEDGDAPKVR